MMIWNTGTPIKNGLYVIKLKGEHWSREPHTLYQMKTAVWHDNTFTYLNGYFEKDIVEVEEWCEIVL